MNSTSAHARSQGPYGLRGIPTDARSEIDGQTSAQHRQVTLLAEVADRRLARMAERQTETSPAATNRRLPAIVRRLVGAPTFA
jgi:hypothetical protein